MGGSASAPDDAPEAAADAPAAAPATKESTAVKGVPAPKKAGFQGKKDKEEPLPPGKVNEAKGRGRGARGKGGSGGSGDDAHANPRTKLCVKNLPEDCTPDALRVMFAEHGAVSAVEVKTRNDGKSRGFGFVTFSTEKEASAAMSKLGDSINKDGSKLIVVLAEPHNGKGKNGEAKGKGKDGKDGQKGKGAKDGKGKDGKGKDGKGKDATRSQAYSSSMYTQAEMQRLQQMQQLQQQQQQWGGYGYNQQGYQGYGGYGAAPYPYSTSTGVAVGQDATRITYAATPTTVPAASGPKLKEYEGSLKSLSERNGYGFVLCQETFNLFSRDVYVDKKDVPENAKVLDRVRFQVAVNEKGHPKATNVVVVSMTTGR